MPTCRVYWRQHSGCFSPLFERSPRADGRSSPKRIGSRIAMPMCGSPRSSRRFLSQRVLALAALAVLGFSAAQEQGDVCRAYPLVQIPLGVVANLLISKLLCWGRASHGGSLVMVVFVSGPAGAGRLSAGRQVVSQRIQQNQAGAFCQTYAPDSGLASIFLNSTLVLTKNYLHGSAEAISIPAGVSHNSLGPTLLPACAIAKNTAVCSSPEGKPPMYIPPVLILRRVFGHTHPQLSP